MAADDGCDGAETARHLERLADELEQATVALEDAREEAAALARERNALRTEVRTLRTSLAEERARLARRDQAAEEVRRKFDAAAAEFASREAAEVVTGEELQVSLEELRVTAEELEEANGALARLNQGLLAEVAARTAELELANAALREREERLRLILEGATDYAIFVLDPEGRVSEWNPGAERVLGFSAEEVVGRRPRGMWTPEDRASRQPELEMCGAVEHGRAEDDRWHLRKDGSRIWASGVMMPLLDGEGRLRGFLKILRDRTAARLAEERRQVLLNELNHRVKNTLAVVQSIATQTLRHAGVPAEVRSVLLARLAALARSHDLLMRGEWQGASLLEVVGQTLAAHAAAAGEGRITTSGPPVRLPPGAVVTANLAFHELATNAAKYGALSTPEGRVEVAWTLGHAEGDGPRVVEILWRERGGPSVRPPERRGFGSQLLERALSRESGAEVALDFAPEGVECRIRLPLTAETAFAEGAA